MDVNEKKERNTFAAETVNKMRIDVDCACLRMEYSRDPGEICVELRNGQNGDLVCYQSGDNLSIRYKVWKNIINLNWGAAELLVTIPAGKLFDGFWVNIGAGSAELYNVEINCLSMEIDAGAGKIVVGQVKAAERLDVSVGAGSAAFYNTETTDMKVDCGVGQFLMEGSVERDLKVDCGVGKCKIRLKGKENEYNFDVSCGLGSVKINHSLSSRMGSKQQIRNSGAKGNIVLSNGLGEIDLMVEPVCSA